VIVPPLGGAGGSGGGGGGAAAAAAKSAPGQGREAQAAAPLKRPQLAPADLRRRLARGAWPRKEDILLGDLLSSTTGAIEPTPEGAPDAPLRVRADLVRSPWQPEHHLLRVAVQGRSAPPPARRPANLVFVIDVSDSMAAPNRLALVQEGIRRMADRLIPADRIAVITYAASAKLLLPSQPLGEKGLELRNTLAGLTTAGRTNGSAGLRLGLDVARAAQVEGGPNFVVLCTDGNFNLGDTEPAPLAALAGAAAAEGIHLSVFGFGRSDRNDLRLELLATAGHGRSCYVNTRDEAERLLAGQVDGLFAAAAVDVELKVAFDSRQVAAVRRVDDPAAEALDVKLPEVLPGRVAAAWYELTLRDEAGVNPGSGLAKIEAGYRRPGGDQRERQVGEAPARAAAWSRTDESFRFGAATTEFARILQAGPAASGPELDRLEAWVRANLPEAGGYRTELLENIAAAREAAAGAQSGKR
jgi:Ca-activated chloride channel family protein